MGTLFDVLDRVRRRPGMWIGFGEKEYRLQLRAIEQLIAGYEYALHEHGIAEPGSEFRKEFADFVKVKKGWHEAFGPIDVILHFVKDDAKAWDTLWELIDEFRKTKEPSKVTPE